MEKTEQKQNQNPGDIIQVATEIKPVVINEAGEKILCENEKEALIFSYLIKIWSKLNSK